MAGAALGIIGNQVVARYKLVVGRRIQSATLMADARHSWLDALSSLDALVGLALVALGCAGETRSQDSRSRSSSFMWATP